MFLWFLSNYAYGPMPILIYYYGYYFYILF